MRAEKDTLIALAAKLQTVPEQLDFLRPRLQQLQQQKQKQKPRGSNAGPLITLSYAQSLDGSIALNAGAPLPLSGKQSMLMTHVLRAHHDALLVGINTILTDDPQLNVRYYQGQDPQPVILDCQLRFPVQARVLTASSKAPLLVTTQAAPVEKRRQLQEQGIQVHCVEQTSEGRIKLSALRQLLMHLGINSIMIEGGAEVLNQFYREAMLDYCVITIVPQIIGGLKAVDRPCNPPLQLHNCQYRQLGADLIAYGAIA